MKGASHEGDTREIHRPPEKWEPSGQIGGSLLTQPCAPSNCIPFGQVGDCLVTHMLPFMCEPLGQIGSRVLTQPRPLNVEPSGHIGLSVEMQSLPLKRDPAWQIGDRLEMHLRPSKWNLAGQIGFVTHTFPCWTVPSGQTLLWIKIHWLPTSFVPGGQHFSLPLGSFRTRRSFNVMGRAGETCADPNLDAEGSDRGAC